MPTDDEPKGTLGHAKAMASATYLYESARGNSYPRLDLSVDYRDPKHVRLRSYDSDGRVVDTLGANDISEAVLLAGHTVRYAETMYARKLRAGVPPKQRPPVSFRFLDRLILQLRQHQWNGAADSLKRVEVGEAAKLGGLQFHATHWSNETELRRVRALAWIAVRVWAVASVEAVERRDMAQQLLQMLPDDQLLGADHAELFSAQLRGMRDTVRRTENNPAVPVTNKDAASVLHEVMLAASHLAVVGRIGADDAVDLPDDPLARSVEHAAAALGRAFVSGVVTELPPETTKVLAWLDRVA